MNHPYYTNNDQISTSERKLLWQRVHPKVPKPKGVDTTISLHWTSFLYGNVAAAVFIFAAFGAWSLLQDTQIQDQVRSEIAYEQGMQLMMQSTAEMVATAPMHKRELLEAKVMSIEDIDRAIEDIRNDMIADGITPINQRQLRAMYALKLDYLKELLIAGDLES
jgi:hypothetical protein